MKNSFLESISKLVVTPDYNKYSDGMYDFY